MVKLLGQMPALRSVEMNLATLLTTWTQAVGGLPARVVFPTPTAVLNTQFKQKSCFKTSGRSVSRTTPHFGTLPRSWVSMPPVNEPAFPLIQRRRYPPSYLLQLLCRTSRSCIFRSTARSTRERTTQTPASTVSFPNLGCFGGRPPPFRSTLRCPTHRLLGRLSSPGTGGGRGVA